MHLARARPRVKCELLKAYKCHLKESFQCSRTARRSHNLSPSCWLWLLTLLDHKICTHDGKDIEG